MKKSPSPGSDANPMDRAPHPDAHRARDTVAEAREAVVLLREASADLREDHLNAMESALTDAAEARADARRAHAELRDANEHLVLASLHSHELTEAAQARHRQQEEFLAMMAHELRNPLASIGGAAGVLSRYTDREPALVKVHEVLTRHVRQMARLLDDLLDVSRVTRGHVVLRRQPVALADVIGEAVEACRLFIDARGQHLSVNLPPGSIAVDGDPMRLAQVFGNLLHNAAKYTPLGGAIGIELGREGESAVVRVSDDGVGIAAEMLPLVFDLFTQEYQSPERAAGGLGIGLTVVRGVVELHGGTIAAHSGGRGQGSAFVVTLPALPAESPAERLAAAPRCEAVPLPAPRTYRILLVDDSVDSGEMLALLLGMDGHEVSITFDGAAALEMARRTAPEIVLCDIGLPGMDGYAVARGLLEQSAGTPPLLIALTGYGDATSRARAMAAGFSHHLVKPVELETLLQLIANAGGG